MFCIALIAAEAKNFRHFLCHLRSAYATKGRTGVTRVTEIEPGVALRIRAVMTAFQIPTNPKLGEICGASASSVNNWLSGYNLPRVPEMIRLCERTGITLDWIYRGTVNTMPPQLAIDLGRILDARDAQGQAIRPAAL